VTGDEIREVFLHFFKEKGHEVVPSSSLVPQADPTLLLTSAGMVQFKRYFTGEATPPHTRLASCQKCFRTTDIDSVGNSKHLTFFEMLGNFSVGDYFKKEAIAWAWEFVTQRLKLPTERLWITIFLDDDEAFGYWREMGVPEEKILRFGEEDNFWGPAGDTGPCGPCSEIHYDLGAEIGCGKPDCGPNCACGRFVEIWNLVFTQYDQQEDGRRLPLPKPNIDTGMGLERTSAAVQGKPSVYETDLFSPLIELASKMSGKSYGQDEAIDRALRVVAEHGRAITFLIADGIVPGNEGRGYVLRRVLRRAALFGRKLGLEEPFLGGLAKAVVSQMERQYPELVEKRDFILDIIAAEEERFGQTLTTGLTILDGMVDLKKEARKAIKDVEGSLRVFASDAAKASAQGDFERWVTSMTSDFIGQQIQGKLAVKAYEPSLSSASVLGMQMALTGLYEHLEPRKSDLKNATPATIETVLEDTLDEAKKHSDTISGKEVFELYDTYGFPKELTAEIAAENGLTVDSEAFEEEMEQQRERARAAQKFALNEEKAEAYASLGAFPTTFVGDERLKHSSTIVALLVNGEPGETASKGQEAEVVLRETPFYGEMGGQVGDTGEVRGESGRIAITNAIWPTPEVIVHQGKVIDGHISVGDEVEAIVDEKRRFDIARNHTATHLLQAALRQVLGSQVQQSGSLVAPERLRFDFTHVGTISKEQLNEVQRIVNEMVRHNLQVKSKISSYSEAIAQGALAFFGEKYGDEVRVLEIGEPVISAELCGGTHVNSTGQIGLFLIADESSIGAGMRRIEAVTGRGAEELVETQLSIVEDAAQELKVPASDISSRVSTLQKELDAERKRALSLEREVLKHTVDSLLSKAESIAGVTVLTAKVPASNMESLRYTGDLIKERLGSVVVVLGAVYNNQANFVAMVTPDLVARGLNAGQIVKQVAAVAGGSGGGRAEMGQAGGKDKRKIDDALKLVRHLIEGKG